MLSWWYAEDHRRGVAVACVSTEAERIADRLRVAGCVRADDEAALLLGEPWDTAELGRRVARRERGEPLEWVLGWADFDGLRLALAPGVFVPRQRTVPLARLAASLLAASPDPQVLLDTCTGCGAIACVAARRCPDALVLAGDLDSAAVRCAAQNGRRYGVSVVRSDLLSGFPVGLRGSVRVIVGNVPYVPTGELAKMPVDAREWEPELALSGGLDGLGVLRELAVQAGEWLGQGGRLLTETALNQSADAGRDLEALGYAVDMQQGPEDDGSVVLTATLG